ncbi:Xaa-Pro aminopeptidase [Candidatus Thermokryptus mobilis]|uniref:Xaa-Pro aminopeptidase n=1 Tax=Candidatus Thermokryptus mobilis TaxID=1643428 RepID=A0A0S4N3A2_9BACT|nr:aminopeptidase P family protein [Candidatus Thermokryptus mobilis]CUU05541.1 Xaa-Pro aminopeptidase [Candidatus Thermokryptus mobilis]
MRDWKAKVENVRKKLEEIDIDAILINHLPNIRYLTGFSGSSALCVITREKSFFITDFRYREQAKIQVKGFKRLIAVNESFFELIERKKILKGLRKIGFEAEHLAFLTLAKIRAKFKKIKLIPTYNFIEEISAIKTNEEIKLINEAIRISEKVFNEVLNLIKPGISEVEIASEISYLQRRNGAERDAFDIIVASGWRGALPHGVATNKKIKKGELVVIDFGCVYNGYHSDITRTIAVGKISSEAKKIYNIVLEAQERAIEAVRPGMRANELDAVARKFIKAKGYGKFFKHSLGHGIGTEIHTIPSISPRSDYVLKDGNVITIEPGIYIPGFCGVRIEDDILINSTAQILTTLPKNLIEL